MKRIYPALVVIALAFGALGFSRGKAPTPSPSVSPSVAPSPSPVPSHQVPGGLEFKAMEYYSTPAQRLKTASAGRKVNEVLQSQCFRDFMLAQNLKETGGRTRLQVVDHLQSLRAIIPVNFYYSRWSSAVAYRQPPSMDININTKFLGANTPDCELAATFAHEGAGHSVGEYDHSYKWTRDREDSVAYVLGGRANAYGGDVFVRCCK